MLKHKTKSSRVDCSSKTKWKRLKMGYQLYISKYKHWNAKKSKAILVIMCVSAQLQSCPTFWDSVDCKPSGSSVHGIFQARILECVAISYFRRSSWPRNWTSVSCIFCIGRWILYHRATWEAPLVIILFTNLATHVNSHLYMKILNLSLI